MNPKPSDSNSAPPLRLEELQARLEEAEETLRAIRGGEVDALVIAGPQGDQIYTLKGGEHPYRVMVEAMNEGAATLNGEGTIIYSNRSFATILQIALEEVIGSPISRFVLADDLTIYEKLFQLAQHGSAKGEVRLKGLSEIVVPVYLSISSLRSTDAQTVCVLITDLSDQKRHQELAASEARERTIRAEAEAAQRRISNVLESITDAFFAMDRQWRITDVNQRAAAVFGKTREELVDKVFWDLFPQDRSSELSSHYRLAMAERVPTHGEGRSLIAVGGWFEVHCYPTEEGLAIYFRDISERKRAEEALRASEERFRHMVEGVTDYALYTLDLEGRVLTWNDGAARMKGYSSEEVLGRHFSLFYEPHDVKSGKPEQALKEAANTGRSEDEGWRVRKDQSRFWANAIVTALRDDTGKLKAFSKMTRDMSERKRAEEKLRRSEFYLAEGERLSHTASWAWNVTSGEIYWSEELYRIFGLDPATVKLSYPAVLKYVHPEDRSRTQKAFDDAVREEREYELAYRVVWSDGTIRHVNNLAHPVFDEAGGLKEYVGTTIDTTERIRAEQKLRRSEAYLVEGQRLTLTGSGAWNVSTGEMFCSQELLRIFGLDAPDVKPAQEDFLRLIHPEDQPRVREAIARAVEFKTDYDVEYRIVKGDGSIRHIHNVARPVLHESGALVELIGTAADITERKHAEAKLRRSEANLAEGQSLSHTGSWVWNVSTGECFWSLEHFRICGLDPESFHPTKENTQRLIHPGDLPLVAQALERAVQERSDFEVEYRFLHPDGSIRHHRGIGRPSFQETGEVEFVGSVMDITERKLAEEAVRKAYERVDLILASISDQFFGLSKDWCFTYFNQHAAAQMKRLGKDPERLLGKELWQEFPRVPNEADLRRVMSERVPITDELYDLVLGEWVENHMYPSPDGGIVTFQRYVTARKRTEEELRRTQEKLAHVTRLTMMGEFAASIAHEINQPLGAIVNNSNAFVRLLSQPGSSEEIRAALADIATDALRASAIIKHIRLLTKRSVAEEVWLPIEDVVADVLGVAHHALLQSRVTVRTELARDLPHLFGDRVQLQQVLLNLVMNAIEAMAEVGDERRVLNIRGERGEVDDKPAVLILVRDFGSGIRPEDSERLFEAFFTTKSHGMGMGLRISRSIVESHGGRLWGLTNAVHGATFVCALPDKRAHLS